jgi:hypothetical protein
LHSPLVSLSVATITRLAHQLRQLGDIHRDPQRLILGKQLGAERRPVTKREF